MHVCGTYLITDPCYLHCDEYKDEVLFGATCEGKVTEIDANRNVLSWITRYGDGGYDVIDARGQPRGVACVDAGTLALIPLALVRSPTCEPTIEFDKDTEVFVQGGDLIARVGGTEHVIVCTCGDHNKREGMAEDFAEDMDEAMVEDEGE